MSIERRDENRARDIYKCATALEVEVGGHQEIGPTFKRYIVLFLFCLNTGNKSFQWIQIPASTTKATIFYDVENYVINFASIIFMLSFILISWPACYLIQRIGIRRAILLASFGTIIGSTVKCCSCIQNGVGLMLVGQTIISLSEQLVHQIPTRLASIWFPDSQVSLCVSICTFGNQLGVAIGFLVPQWLMQDAHTRDEIGPKLYQLFLITLIYSSLLFVFNWLLFDEAPPHPPGLARQHQMAIEAERTTSCANTQSEDKTIRQLIGQIGRLYGNRDLVLISICFGMTYGRSDTISTLLDQTLKPIFPNNPTLVGNVGFLIVISGALGAPIWGRLLDKTHAYKKINLAIVICTFFTLIGFAYAVIYLQSEWLIYISATLFGFFQSGAFVSALEFAVELTYPAPEIITSSVMFIKAAILGPILILIGSFIVDNCGALATNGIYIATLLISFICVLCCRERLNRQEAIKLQLENEFKRFKKTIIGAQ